MTTWSAQLAEISPRNTVRRGLPQRAHRRVGPFVFCDHFGPSGVPSKAGVTAPEHPHVGLQTVTYLLTGQIRHRDTLGSDQTISPGEVNLMTAGAGIVHEEATLGTNEPLEGLQLWVGLPHAVRHSDPAFAHVGRPDVPVVPFDRGEVRVVLGRLGSHRSHVSTYQAVHLFDVRLEPGGQVELATTGLGELGLYVTAGQVFVAGRPVSAHEFALLSDGDTLSLSSEGDARLVVLGGDALAEPTVIWWNFVVDSVDEGKAYEAKWREGGFDRL